MKVKTLVAMLMQSFDDAEIYTDNMVLIRGMSPENLLNEYGDCKVKKFWIYQDEAYEITTLELILR